MADQPGKYATLDPVSFTASDDKTIDISGISQRRKSPRFPFSAAARVVDLETKARVDGRTSDLSIGGCYVDSLAPMRVGARVSIRIEHGGRLFEGTCRITYAHVGLGMGMMFIELKPRDQSVLAIWLSELSGEEIPAQTLELPSNEPPAAASVESLHLAIT